MRNPIDVEAAVDSVIEEELAEPTAAPAISPDDAVLDVLEEGEQEKDAAIRAAFDPYFKPKNFNPDRQAAVLRLQKDLGADAKLVEEHFDEIKASYEFAN